ncbi:MAG: histidine kinase dimerization/phospho-acceptor domain-containing protein [bacterium]
MRLVFAIPFLTTGIILGFGLLVIYINQKMLLNPFEFPTPFKVHSLLNSIFAATVITAFGSLIAGAILAYAIVRPFKDFNKVTSRLAKGDFTGEVRARGVSELAQLTDTFNQMIISLNHFLLDKLSGGNIVIDENGRVLSMNSDAETILGATAEKLSGRLIGETFLGSGENSEFRDTIMELLRNKTTTIEKKELRLIRPDKSGITISLSSSLQAGKSSPVIGISVHLEDITHLKQVQEQLRRIDRLAAIDSLASSVAHNVRNPLCSIRGFAQLINERAAANPEWKEYSRQIIRDADKINQIIEHLIDNLQPGTSEWKYYEVESVVRNTLYRAKEGELNVG